MQQEVRMFTKDNYVCHDRITRIHVVELSAKHCHSLWSFAMTHFLLPLLIKFCVFRSREGYRAYLRNCHFSSQEKKAAY